jgi:methyltransferase-like protein 6
MNEELQLAVSYYNIYANNHHQTSSHPQQQTKTKETKEDAPWQDDAWTEQDAADAESLLAEGVSRCRIRTTSNNDDEGRIWDDFYNVHRTNFFKDRHYLANAFPNEFAGESTIDNNVLVEIGCGVGNAMLPLLPDSGSGSGSDSDSTWTVIGVDLSQVAIDLLKQDPRYLAAAANGRAQAYAGDITRQLPDACIGVASVTTLLFCLSAIDPVYHMTAARNAAASLRPGGVLILRDYGRYDQAQLKLGAQRNKLLKEHFYRKHDQTKVYYFDVEDMERLCQATGLIPLENGYFCRKCTNRSTQSTRRRVWIQARFQKPIE